jgi:uncharacterized membrane-anchored protein YhcB (DUF1043 family)
MNTKRQLETLQEELQHQRDKLHTALRETGDLVRPIEEVIENLSQHIRGLDRAIASQETSYTAHPRKTVEAGR